MSIEVSDSDCPNCGEKLRVIYVSKLEQVVSGWSCPECGFVASKKQQFTEQVPLIEDEEFLIRKLKPISSEDVRNPLGNVEDEFRARASTDMDEDEVWMLIDPETQEVKDVIYGVEREQEFGTADE